MEEMERDGIGLIRPEDKEPKKVSKVVPLGVKATVDANKAGLKAVKNTLENKK